MENTDIVVVVVFRIIAHVNLIRARAAGGRVPPQLRYSPTCGQDAEDRMTCHRDSDILMVNKQTHSHVIWNQKSKQIGNGTLFASPLYIC